LSQFGWQGVPHSWAGDGKTLAYAYLGDTCMATTSVGLIMFPTTNIIPMLDNAVTKYDGLIIHI